MASQYQNKDVRTTVRLDQDVYEAARHLSRSSGRRLGQVLSELARRGLAGVQPPASRKKRRFPSFKVPPGTPMIAVSKVQEVIDEEGLF
jgi:hypothetical protein